MRVASWDVGIKHLALCILDQSDAVAHAKIVRWELVSLPGKGLAEIVRSLFGILQGRVEELQRCDHVLIERQAGLNRKMSVISHCLQTWCLCRSVPASFCDPRSKLRFFDGQPVPEKLPNDKYARTKALGKWHAQRFLDTTHAGTEFHLQLRRANKADDLAVRYCDLKSLLCSKAN